MPKGVSCAVDTCTFWEENNKCNAKAIEIQTDYAAILRSMKQEFASELDQIAPEVRHSIDTCCQTYKPKGEDNE